MLDLAHAASQLMKDSKLRGAQRKNCVGPLSVWKHAFEIP